MDPLPPFDCPECKLALEPTPLSRDPDHRVCPRCGLDRLGAIMRDIAAGGVLWDYREAELHLRWGDGACPSLAELTALKELIPTLRRRPLARLAQGLAGARTWLLATVPAVEGRALFARARELGLGAEIVYLPETRGTSAERGGDVDDH